MCPVLWCYPFDVEMGIGVIALEFSHLLVGDGFAVGAFAGRAVAGAVFVGEDAKDFKHVRVARTDVIMDAG